MQPAELVVIDQPRRRRRIAVLVAAAVAVVLAGAGVIGYVLLRSDTQPQAASAPTAAATSPADMLGRSACKAVFTREILAPDTIKTMSEKDWQVWVRDVKRIADDAVFSSNREVARAGKDLQSEFKGDMFIPAEVQEAAGRFRDVCERVDYIHIPTR